MNYCLRNWGKRYFLQWRPLFGMLAILKLLIDKYLNKICLCKVLFDCSIMNIDKSDDIICLCNANINFRPKNPRWPPFTENQRGSEAVLCGFAILWSITTCMPNGMLVTRSEVTCPLLHPLYTASKDKSLCNNHWFWVTYWTRSNWFMLFGWV